MDEPDMRRLYGELKELGAKLDNLTDLFNRAAYGDGFPRCARQDSRIANLADSVERCHDRVSGMKKWLWAGLVALAATSLNYVWERIKSQ